MSSKIASYLQQHLSGEVVATESVRQFFSTDASILEIKPSLVVYPRSTSDVRKVSRFTWQLAEKGHVLPITARGSGTDLSGAAIGKGVVMVFPAHLNKVLEIDTKQQMIRVQPGVNFASLQETLNTHGLFLPPAPASYEYSTIGGAVANNTAGAKSIKYGTMRDYVERLEVVLANGEVIETGPLSHKQLEHKKGLATLEGEIYRRVDAILDDNNEALAKLDINVSKNSMGYALNTVKRGKTFDLTPLFVGSQGTLGLITEIIIRVEPYTPQNHLLVASFSSLENTLDAVDKLRAIGPSALEIVDRNMLEFSKKQRGHLVAKHLLADEEGLPEHVLFVEFDDVKSSSRSKKAKRAAKALNGLADHVVNTDDANEQELAWTLRQISSDVTTHTQAGKTALPIIDDGVVPTEAYGQFVRGVRELFVKHHLDYASWGHVGESNLHLQPMLDLQKLGDRQKVFKLMDDYHKLVFKLGGSVAAEHNDGRLRAFAHEHQYGSDVADIFVQLKEACDPHGTLNVGVKTGTDLKTLISQLRKDYSLVHLSHHVPRT